MQMKFATVLALLPFFVAAAPAAPGQQPDYGKIHTTESQNLQLAGLKSAEHAGKSSAPGGVRRWVGDGLEARVLAQYASLA